MRRDSKGPRLWFRAKPEPGEWIIKDYPNQRRTGCGFEQRREAEEQLARYLNDKRRADKTPRDPALIPVATVLQDYLDEVAPRHARPYETGLRARALLGFFGSMALGDITGQVCRRYAAQRSTPAAARRELQDLRAAIRHHWREGRATHETMIVLPPRSRPRDRWLTRTEAAALLRAARNRSRHVARFILIALYTGSRAGVVLSAVYGPGVGRAAFDLEAGVFYRAGRGHIETRKRRPPAPLSRRLLAHLRRWKHLDDAGGHPGPVFFRGHHLKSIYLGFRAAARAAGLEGVSPHTLRHTAATWLMQAGEDPWKAAGLLGMSVHTLLQTYGHHHPQHQAAAAETLARGGRRA